LFCVRMACVQGARANAKAWLPSPGPHPNPGAWSSHWGWLKDPGDLQWRHPQWLRDPNSWARCWRASLAYLAAPLLPLLFSASVPVSFALLSNTPQPIWRHHRQVPRASQECRAPSTIVAPKGSWGGFALHPARQSWQLRACGALRLQRPRVKDPPAYSPASAVVP
jgi:hypothetical protein